MHIGSHSQHAALSDYLMENSVKETLSHDET